MYIHIYIYTYIYVLSLSIYIYSCMYSWHTCIAPGLLPVAHPTLWFSSVTFFREQTYRFFSGAFFNDFYALGLCSGRCRCRPIRHKQSALGSTHEANPRKCNMITYAGPHRKIANAWKAHAQRKYSQNDKLVDAPHCRYHTRYFAAARTWN